MIADIISIKKVNVRITELFIENFIPFITQPYFAVLNDFGQYSTHCFIMKTQKKKASINCI